MRLQRRIPSSVQKAIGQKFNQVRVLEYVGAEYITKRWRHFVRCQCDCGKVFMARCEHITEGNKKHCGCIPPIVNQLSSLDFRNRESFYCE